MENQGVNSNYNLQMILSLLIKTPLQVIEELETYKRADLKLLITQILTELESAAASDKQDILRHLHIALSHCIYHAMRNGFTELIELLFDKMPGNYFTSRTEELDAIISAAYKDLKTLKNVELEEEMEFCIAKVLLNIRFFTDTKVFYTHDDISKRICFIISCIKKLKSVWESNDNEENFILICKYIAQNIFILKSLLKQTYCRIPWEEMEFCLVAYIQNTKYQSTDINCLITREELLKYLEIFSDCLKKETKTISEFTIEQLSKIPRKKRDDVVKDILRSYPLFEEFFENYQSMRDNHSLGVISEYVRLVTAVDPTNENDQLVIIRALQVIGEKLKNTLESPKLSSNTSDMVVYLFPYNTSQLIMRLRNSLSHGISLFKYEESNVKEKADFFAHVQKDISKIESGLTNILYRSKFKIIRKLMKKIVSSNNVEEIRNTVQICCRFQSNNKTTLFSPVRNELDEVERLVSELEIKIRLKTDFEENMLQEIKRIINDEKCKFTYYQKTYEDILILLEAMKIYSSILSIKHFAEEVLKCMEEEIKFTYFEKLAKLTVELWKACSKRMENEDDLCEIWIIAYKIVWTIDFESQNMKNIEKMTEKLNKGMKNYAKLEKSSAKDGFLIEKLKLLQNILVNKLNVYNFHSFQSFKKNKKSQAEIEVVLLTILSILNDIKNTLSDNLLSFDNDAPYLVGKNLRKHLAHGNALNDALFVPSMAIFLNAKIISEIDVMQIGTNLKTVKETKAKSLTFQAKLEKDLISINYQTQLFLTLANGLLEEAEYWVLKGADIRGRDRELKTAIHYAARAPNLECLKFLLHHGLNINAKDIRKQSLLHAAATYGKEEIVDFLITEQKMSFEEFDKHGYTPLHLAAANGCTKAVEFLLLHSSKTNCRDEFGLAPLHYAVKNNHLEIVRLLMEKEGNVDSNKITGGLTSLHLAASRGHVNVVEYLFEKGADVDAKTDDEATPLHFSVFEGHLLVTEILILHGADVNAQTNDGMIPLHNAAKSGYENIVEVLIKYGSIVNRFNPSSNPLKKGQCPEPMFYAVDEGYLNIVKTLIKNGASVENRTEDGLNFLHFAAMHSNKDIIGILLENGSQINVQDDSGRTPLHFSIMINASDVTQLLIAKGADVIRKDNEGLTPLHYASLCGNSEAMVALISGTADVSLTDETGNTPLHSCVVTSHIPEIATKYMKKGLSFEENTVATHKEQDQINIMELLIRNGVNLECKNNLGQTPLHIACLHQNNIFAEYLVNKTANVLARDKKGYTPLLYAVLRNNLEIVKILFHRNVDQLVDITDLQDKSPLLIAVSCNYSSIVEFFVEKGADVNFGEPLYIAVSKGLQKITKTLINAKNINIEKQFEQHNTNIIEVAARNGYEQLLGFLIAEMKKTSNISTLIPKTFKNALSSAASQGYHEAVKILLKNGANVNETNEEGFTPMHAAANRGHVKVGEILISHGANCNIADKRKILPIEIAVFKNHLNFVKLLIEHKKVDINAEGLEGFTLLHAASNFGYLEIVKYLVSKGADIYSEDISGSKPIHIASEKGHTDIVEFFLNCKMPIDVRGCNEGTLLHCAAKVGHYQLCEYLIKQGIDVNSTGSCGETPLHVASVKGHIKVIILLLENGAFLNCLDNLKVKALHLSNNENIRSLLLNTEKLFQAANHNSVSDVEDCIEKGAVVNVKNSKNVSLLHYACWKADKAIVEILLKNKCNPNIKGKDEAMPLHYAAKFNSFETVRILLENGAIYNHPSKGKIPIQVTTDKETHELLQLISDCFEDIQNNRINVINKIKVLMSTKSFKALMNARNIKNNTILIEAYRNNFSKINQFTSLLEKHICPSHLISRELEFEENYEFNKLNFILEKNIVFLGPDNPLALNIQEKIAESLYNQQKYEDALKIFKEIHLKRKEMLGTCNSDNLKTQNMIALTLYKLGNYHKALEIFEEAYEKQKVFLGENHVEVLSMLCNKALTLEKVDRHDEAIQINRKVYEAHCQTIGAEKRTTINVLCNIGSSLYNSGRHQEAEDIFGRVYALREKILGTHHPDTLRAQFNMIKSQIKTFSPPDFNTSDKILKKLRHILISQREILMDNDIDILNTETEIGNVLVLDFRLQEALEVLSENLRKRRIMSSEHDQAVMLLEKKIKVIKSMTPIRYAHLTGIRKHCESLITLFRSEFQNMKQNIY